MGLEQDLKTIKNAELDIELLHRDNDKLCAKNNGDIADLEDKIKSTEFILEEELKASKEDKIECKFDGYKGSIGWQKMPDKWIYIDNVLLDWILSFPKKLKEPFLKVITTVRKSELKKKIMIDNMNLFENGKIIEQFDELFLFDKYAEASISVKGIEIESQDPKFKYTIKKIK